MRVFTTGKINILLIIWLKMKIMSNLLAENAPLKISRRMRAKLKKLKYKGNLKKELKSDAQIFYKS